MTINRIKASALRSFALQGYEGTSLGNIAKEVGIKTPSLYSHFKSKDDLFLSILDDVINNQQHEINQLIYTLNDQSPEDKLLIIFKHFSSYNKQNLENIFFKRALFFPPETLSETIKIKFLTFEEVSSKILTDIFKEGISSGIFRQIDISVLIASFYCILDGLFVEYHYYNEDEYKSRVNAVWSVFWAGISTR